MTTREQTDLVTMECPGGEPLERDVAALTTKPVGKCPTCLAWCYLRDDGTLRWHTWTQLLRRSQVACQQVVIEIGDPEHPRPCGEPPDAGIHHWIIRQALYSGAGRCPMGTEFIFEPRSDFLFAHPGFWAGTAAVFDFAGALFVFNESITPGQADALALTMDFMMVGDDVIQAANVVATVFRKTPLQMSFNDLKVVE